MASRHQLHTGDWLLRRLRHTLSTITGAQTTLEELCREKNPYQEDSNYTLEFFSDQWKSERAANKENAKDIKIRQKIELGRLLVLEEAAHQTW